MAKPVPISTEWPLKGGISSKSCVLPEKLRATLNSILVLLFMKTFFLTKLESKSPVEEHVPPFVL